MVTIKLKRGNNVNLSGLSLEAGEPAFVLDTGKLYLGNGTDKVLINPDPAAISPEEIGAVPLSDVVTTAAANKILKLNASSELPANAASATKLKTARTLSLSGDASGSTSFDGSANKEIEILLANSGVTAGTYTKVTVDAKGRVTSATNLSAADIPGLTLAKITDAGTAASKNTGTAGGNIPVLDANGKLDAAVVPAIAISDTFVVASQTAMLGLTAEVGDIAVRTDQNKSYILRTAGASTLANWQELLSPTSPVQSVAGKTGAVTLTAADVGLGNVTNESKTTLFASAALTGIPTAPTAAAATNTTQVATTAFVKAQGYLSSGSVVDGGTF
ncbi:hypothetical protein [Desulforamulus ruminis]|uniref:hyaluronate lyase N-terminal domain-containing protein n=1 Tax=Desulforamulus ruminis TaxID=1564 RepID=UPI0023524548|nr:hypothetical protein [Desulforamulus ruminis]